MIGMRAPPEQPMLSASALEAGSGLYHDISHNHRRLKRAYRLFETVIYLALLVQTLLSTIFIVLGSVKGDYHICIAVLGAVSAVIAGVLALTKGTGMPNRIRMERDSVWEVRRMCEALYWQVNAGKHARYEDVEDIWKRFMDIKRNAAKNHPDTWNASRRSSSAGSNSLR
ncbi:hypothetical protein K431DRAFT_289828 [Polychaeton citri CBS 116435]|uniref:SMODS and SLOG-associating 2TM effector domain-containing protein n=1 Tax=Polychaeton citri CBS 116435 TaxID=1314669 RepID=A0A9P4PXN0_9PEZI|nr:hypothetical protein K431DRAFT_289828 [Polychaeton citri CBS 116435]